MKLARSIFAGALVGLGLGLMPGWGPFSEIKNFKMVLLEMSYQGLTNFLTPNMMRVWGTAAGALALFMILGALAGLLCAILFKRSSFAFSLSFTVGIFTTLCGILWGRLVLFHSNQRMISWEGVAVVLAALVLGLVAHLVIFGILNWLSRYRLEKAMVAVAFLALGGGYLYSPSVEGVPIESRLDPSTSPLKQIVLLGGDGATWDVALPMIEEGKLPNLAKLISQGSWADLRTTLPWKSPILWASIATGKREKDHGIHDFVIRNPETHEVIPTSLATRKVKAIWDIATEAGKRTDVINWYASWPAEPLNGTMVSSRFLRENLPDRIFPSERTPEIDQRIRDLETQGISRDEKMVAEVGLYLLERDRPDFHFLYLRDIDHQQHFFWKPYALKRGSLLARLIYGPTDPQEIEEQGDKIEAAYQELDRVLGEILKRIGPETAVMVVSDHGGGIKTQRRFYFDLNPLLEALGFPQTQVRDATKRPWYENRQIFVNQKSGASPNEVLQSVAHSLTSLKTAGGKPLFTKVSMKATKEGTPYVSVRVNVRLDEKEGIQVQGQEFPVQKVMWKTALTGNHRAQGILAMTGPGIKQGYRIRSASILDITPTLLYLMGLPVADDMEGRVLIETVDPAVSRKKPIQSISTYETGTPRATSRARSSTADDELLEELKSLGYIQ